MFRRKKKQFLVTPKDSEFIVQYLGSLRTLISKGEGCVEKPLEDIWRKSDHGMESVRTLLTVTKKGIMMKRLDPPRRLTAKEEPQEYYGEQLFMVNRISYCSTGKKLKAIFAWIYRHELRRSAVELRVHAVVCQSAEVAYALGSLVWEKFQFCFRDFKLDRKASDRVLERQQETEHSKQRALPMEVPLRTKMNSRPAYKVEKMSVGKTKSLAAIKESNENTESAQERKSHEAEDVDDFENGLGFVESAIHTENADFIKANTASNLR